MSPGRKGCMLVISGPSGCGKSSICRRLLEDEQVEFSISATTRPPRAGEVDGHDYHFMNKESFRGHIEKGHFIEWAEVHGNLYGTLREPMERALAEGRVYLVEIDVQGGTQLKALELPGVYVFVAPPDMESLRRRLVGRGTDAPDVIERRLAKAHEEMRAQDKYDHVLVNSDLESTTRKVRALAGLGPRETTGGSPVKAQGILVASGASAALHKACDLVSKLAQEGLPVRSLLTPRAAQLVSPQLFEALSGEPAQVDEFGASRATAMDHIALARWARLLLVAPATADLLTRLAHGIATDLIVTVSLALEPDVPRLIAPAMNPHMLAARPVQRALALLAEDGWQVLEPGSGHMACGEDGSGRLLEPAELVAAVRAALG